MAEPLFSFGIIADVQYADIDDAMNYTRTRKRFYRGSAELLRNAARHWRQERVQFVVQLGDVIDGQNRWRGASESALEAVLREFDAIPAPVHHVWGNHEFYNFNRETLIASRLNSAPRNASGSDLIDKDIYAYAFSPAPGFRFVLLDAFDLSVIGRAKESEKHQRALRTLRENNHNLHDFNQPPVCAGLGQRFVQFNGGFSEEQIQWLEEQLTQADLSQERVVVFSHLPVLPGAADSICLAWNHDAVLSVLRSHRCFVCFMAGHDHDGGRSRDSEGSAVDHVTLEGVIETAPHSDAFATVQVFEEHMELKGRGRVEDLIISCPPLS
ncbi:hypothetical protein DNTS_016186 [Danionella cerebrum]|uniref:Manganese-dependent ADP-ribose/CDP-alcohol diphosphatase n=1 Tax=Danionella cerebrum TaxID=2873325 RepID=A0A553Q519_9TELE|nr:hypothetical protein DNTS_016186 [Danionella translucida]